MSDKGTNLSIDPLDKGMVMGDATGNKVIKTVNILRQVEVRMTDSAAPSWTLSDRNAILEIPKSRDGSGGTTTGAQRYRVKSVSGDYLTCRTWDGTTEGSADVIIAKPRELRHSLTSITYEGVACTIAYASRTSNLDGKRTVSASGKLDQVEIVIPVYFADDSADSEIFATEPAGGTNLTVSGTPVTWLDLNVAARAWCQIA